MQKPEIITTALVVTGMVGVYALIVKYGRMQKELEVIPTANVHKFDLKGLTLRLDLLMKNPTAGSLKIKFPFVKVHYKDVLVGSSQVVNKDITIPAYGQAVIEKIMLDLPLTNLLSTAAALIKALQKKEPIILAVKAVTGIVTDFTEIPIEKIQEIPLKN
jgi:7-cyano-7-deazaguanine synthase in queuosine biosynthesis